jgi:hypothetical protein
MRVAAIAVLLTGLAATPSLAALPPHYQRQAEFIALIDEAVNAFGIDHPIESIVMKGVDFYEVTSGACSMEMQIVDVPLEGQGEGWVGPRNFAVETGPLVCD